MDIDVDDFRTTLLPSTRKLTTLPRTTRRMRSMREPEEMPRLQRSPQNPRNPRRAKQRWTLTLQQILP